MVNYKMKILIFILMIGVSPLTAQDKSNSEEGQAQEKEARKAQLAQNMDTIRKMVKDKKFVLMADMIQGKRGSYNMHSPNNFIKVEGDEIIIQTANSSYIGYNGLGGITIKGKITGYGIYENKNSIGANIQVSSAALGFTSVNLDVSANGNARAVVRANFGARATFIGNLASLHSGAFEGVMVY